jgi:hypothetical protein
MKVLRHKNERGQILVWTSLMIVTLFSFVGLAIDTGFFYQYKRRMQTAADSAALAGAHEIKANSSITQGELETAARNDASLNGFAHGSGGIEVAIFRPPTSGFYSGNNGYVEAVITHPHQTYFARIFNVLSSSNDFDTVTVRTRAVAGGSTSDCIYVLDPSAESAFAISSGSEVKAGCEANVDSDHAKALSVTSGSTLDATSVDINGGYEATSGSSVSPNPDTGAPVTGDPMQNAQAPSYGSCDHESQVQLTGVNATLSPGVYCGGIKLSSSTVTFSAGVYILKGGGLSVESGSFITGSGVSFYNTGTASTAGRIYISSNSGAQVAAPTTGSMAGILFFQDRALPSSNSSLDALIESGISSYFAGVLYFPKHKLAFRSNSTINTGAPWTQIIVRLFEVSSGTRLFLNVDHNATSPVARATLAE